MSIETHRPAKGQPSDGGLSVCCARIDDADSGRFEAWLSSDELGRAAKFRFEADRDRFVIARGLLRRLLGERLDVDPGSIELAYGRHGKPRLAQDGAELRFSVSHSKDAVALAFCVGREVGIDVERIREDLAVDKLARRYLPAEAAAEVERRTGHDRVHEFFRAWVRMEAYAKARGGGLSLLAETPDPERWSVADLTLFEGYAAAVAVEGSVPIRIRTNVSEILGRTSRLALE